MSTDGRDIHRISAALCTALRGTAGFDFSGPDAVRRGRYANPPAGVVPFAALAAPGVASTTQDAVLGQYMRTLVYDIRAWAACDAGDLDARVETSESLLDALHDALERERLNNASVLYSLPGFQIRSGALDGLADPLPVGFASAFLVVELVYRRRTGLAGTEAP